MNKYEVNPFKPKERGPEMPTNPDDLNKSRKGKLAGERGGGFAEIFSKINIEKSEENIKLIEGQMETRQHPEGYDDIFQSINDEETLKILMSEKGINKIVHSEGLTVWDHTKKALEFLENRDDISEEKKKELRLLIFYHDLGKVSAASKVENIEKTQEQLEKGVLNCVMRGHHKEDLDAIKEGMLANNVSEEDLKIYMKVIENHMNTSLLEQSAKKIVKLFEDFGEIEGERKRVVNLLSLVLEIDGSATENITMKDSELFYSKNEKKLKINSDDLWEKYEEGRRMIQGENEKKLERLKEEELENKIFSGKLTKYLIEERKIAEGKAFGKAVGKIKKIIQENGGLSPEELKRIIDELKLTD